MIGSKRHLKTINSFDAKKKSLASIGDSDSTEARWVLLHPAVSDNNDMTAKSELVVMGGRHLVLKRLRYPLEVMPV